MTNEQMLGKITDALNLIDKYHTDDAKLILKEIQADLTLQVTEHGAVKSISILKAAQKFAKLCAKMCNNRNGINGANEFFDEYGIAHEYIVNGFCGVVYDEPFGDLLIRAEGEPINMGYVLDSARNQSGIVTVPSYAELKRIANAQKKLKQKNNAIILANGTTVVLDYLLQVMELVGIADECKDEETEWINGSPVSAVFIHRGIAHGIVMPIRLMSDGSSKYNIVKDCRKDK